MCVLPLTINNVNDFLFLEEPHHSIGVMELWNTVCTMVIPRLLDLPPNCKVYDLEILGEQPNPVDVSGNTSSTITVLGGTESPVKKVKIILTEKKRVLCEIDLWLNVRESVRHYTYTPRVFMEWILCITVRVVKKNWIFQIISNIITYKSLSNIITYKSLRQSWWRTQTGTVLTGTDGPETVTQTTKQESFCVWETVRKRCISANHIQSESSDAVTCPGNW